MTATETIKVKTPPTEILRFGVYEVDLGARELRRRGLRVKLQQKPFQLLELLLERPGELVTRRQVADRLWPGVHVSFDRSLNTAVNALRRALNDSPRNPRFLETRSGLGYRFIGAIERIHTGQVDIGQAAAQSRARQQRVAVAPFVNIEGIGAMDSVGRGIAEGLIAMLGSNDGINVMAGAASMATRPAPVDITAIGGQLNADVVVSGSIARHGATLCIAIDLTDVKTGWRVWSERFERPMTEARTLEAEIAGGIVAQLRPRLEGVNRSHTPASEAHQDYLKGRYFHSKMTEDALRQGVAYFESALERDPRFALAYAGLADSYSLFAFLDLMRPRDAFSRARELAVSALRIDANLPEAHIALAAIMHFYDWDKTGAEVEYRRALALNPNSAAARRSYAAHLCSLGRFSEALEHLRWAQDLDPLSLTIGNEIAWTLYIAGDYEAALRQAWKTLALEPRFPAAQHTLGLANLQLGLFEDAIIELRNACACSGNHPAAQASLAGALAVTGARDEAAKILHALVEWSRERYISPYSLGTIYAALEEHTTAFQYLERAIAERDVWMVWLALDPRYAALRSDPRWTKLISSLT